MAPQPTVEDTTKDRADSADKEEEQEEHIEEPKEEEQSASASASGSTSKSPEPSSSSPPAPTPADTSNQWQAVWAPQYNAYYFYNPVTQETTWTNPLQPEASSSSATANATAPVASSYTPPAEDPNAEAGPAQPPMSAAAAHNAALQAAALAQGIDPLLAHLDPSLLASTAVPGSSGGPGDLPTFKASFNARTGQFAPSTSRTPGHLSEFERAKRMSEFYFDVGKWEEDLARRGGRLMGEEGDGAEEGEAGKKRKRPTKKDIERFKEQKKQKKIAKTAWLRT